MLVKGEIEIVHFREAGILKSRPFVQLFLLNKKERIRNGYEHPEIPLISDVVHDFNYKRDEKIKEKVINANLLHRGKWVDKLF